MVKLGQRTNGLDKLGQRTDGLDILEQIRQMDCLYSDRGNMDWLHWDTEVRLGQRRQVDIIVGEMDWVYWDREGDWIGYTGTERTGGLL